MDVRRVSLVLSIVAMRAPYAGGKDTVKIEFLVTVPADTPADASVFLAGSLPQVGPWKADGVKLERRQNNQFGLSIELPKGGKLEYKFTRGTWEAVEKGG